MRTHFGSSSSIWWKWLAFSLRLSVMLLSHQELQSSISKVGCLFRWSPQSLSPLPPATPPHWPSPEDLYIPLHHWKGMPGSSAGDTPALHESPPPADTWKQPCFLSVLSGSRQKFLRLLPRLCVTSDPPQFWLNAGSFPDVMRCRDLEGGTRSLKTLALETYSYSPERKDSLNKPHPFAATQFPFFVSWLKPMPFFLLSNMVSGSLLLSPFCPPPTLPTLICLGPLSLIESSLERTLPLPGLLSPLRLWGRTEHTGHQATLPGVKGWHT